MSETTDSNAAKDVILWRTVFMTSNASPSTSDGNPIDRPNACSSFNNGRCRLLQFHSLCFKNTPILQSSPHSMGLNESVGERNWSGVWFEYDEWWKRIVSVGKTGSRLGMGKRQVIWKINIF